MQAAEQLSPTSVTPEKKTALVVDDDAVNRMILEGMLVDSGYEVTLAENGQEAIQQYVNCQPDVVLLDILMPVMDGYQAATRIKELAGDDFVPIIFLTAVTDEDELAKCVKVGGDDFLTKPYSQVILMAKVEALTRMRHLHAVTKKQRDKIDEQNEHLLIEQRVAKRIFSRIINKGCLDSPILKYVLSPLSVFNGDLLLADVTPSGGVNILLGDATGHGLPAAIGAVPVSDLFYALTESGSTIDEIVLELNQKLKNILPPEFFFCASVLNISNDYRVLTMWHGGLPDALIYSAKEKNLKQVIKSTNFPLGVVDNAQLSTQLHTVELDKGDRIYLYSDGITEAKNLEGEEFGMDRLLSCFNVGLPPAHVFNYVFSRVGEFRGQHEQSDDVTFVEINADASFVKEPEEASYKPAIIPYPNDWGTRMQLGPRDFRETNPVSLLTKFMTQVEGLVEHRSNIYVILSELYNNALDHGVLGLDSSIKEGPNGFAEFLTLRQKRLMELTDGEIILNLEHQVSEDGTGELVVHVQDSGKGFDHANFSHKLEENKGVSGRGISLVRSLCKEVRFLSKGNGVLAIYEV